MSQRDANIFLTALRGLNNPLFHLSFSHFFSPCSSLALNPMVMRVMVLVHIVQMYTYHGPTCLSCLLPHKWFMMISQGLPPYYCISGTLFINNICHGNNFIYEFYRDIVSIYNVVTSRN